MYDKSYYITKISNASNRYGDKLLLLMDEYKVTNLQDITTKQAKEFYETYIMESR